MVNPLVNEKVIDFNIFEKNNVHHRERAANFIVLIDLDVDVNVVATGVH